LKDQKGKDENYWQNTLDNPAKRAWCGYSFEQICKDHIDKIKDKLGIAGVLTEKSSWSSKGEPGAQIDLVIERRDRIIDLCEMKFSESEFTIDKEYDLALRNKMEIFRTETKTKKALHFVFITTYGLKRSMYSGIAQAEVKGDDLF